MTHSVYKIYLAIISRTCKPHMTNVSVNRKPNKTVNVCKTLNYLICQVEIFFILGARCVCVLRGGQVLGVGVCMYLLTYSTI